MQEYKPRIFISCIYQLEKDSPQKRIKDTIIKMVNEADFEPQIFLESGLAKNEGWSFHSVNKIMKRCQGAIILGLSRWNIEGDSRTSNPAPTEYNHYEGALAIANGLSTLILLEDGLPERGIFYNGSGYVYTRMPANANTDWFNNSDYFKERFRDWRKAVSERYQVFLGYSSAAQGTATALLQFLGGRLGLRVKEYQTNFRAGGSILEEIEEACNTCLCGIFLFTADDELREHENLASPRDNVIFEAGYFMRAKGKERTLIIREETAKMPADLGGGIYLELKSEFKKQNDIKSIQSDIEYFIKTRL